MIPSRSIFLLAFCATVSFALGCAGPNAQVNQIKADNEKLLSTIKTQKEEQEALLKKAASLEQRLDQSEKEIVRLTGRKSAWDTESRTASSKNSALPVPSTGSASGPKEGKPEILAVPGREEKLPWRSPASSTGPSQTPSKEPAASGPVKAASTPTASLRTLSQRDPRLKYDPATDTARYQQEILFEASGSALTTVGRKRLDELASWLKADQTKELRVLIAAPSTGEKEPGTKATQDSHSARVAAVADYLGSRGISEDRVVLVGPGSPARLLEGPPSGPVQIHLAQSSAPILGQVTKPALRR
jgi:outer membrane protein OmpA-like peptidoglycan-associated protein